MVLRSSSTVIGHSIKYLLKHLPCEKEVLLGRGVVTHVDEAKARLKIENRRAREVIINSEAEIESQVCEGQAKCGKLISKKK